MSSPADVLKKVSALEKHSVKLGRSVLGDLYIRPSRAVKPNWLSLFEGAIDIGRLRVTSSSAAAVLLMRRGDPFFSRVTLRNTYRELTGYGFNVSCTKITMTQTAGG